MTGVKNSNGLTLIEIMTLIVIISILAAVSIPHYQSYTGNEYYKVTYEQSGELRTYVFDLKPVLNGGCAISNDFAICNVISMEKITLGER